MAPPDTFSLQGKVAIVTGSGRETGIGAGIARSLARNGALVVINHVNPASASRAEEVVKSIQNDGGRAVVIRADVSTPEGAAALVQRTLDSLNTKTIDILVNNAGGPIFGSALGASQEDVERVFGMNFFSALYMMQNTVPHMPKGARIVNVGSIAAKLGIPETPLYGAAKAALDALSFAISHELGREKGITINTVDPGPVSTDITTAGGAVDGVVDALLPMTRAEVRLGRVADIADAVQLLVSEKSRWITGQVISVSGGITGSR